MAKARILITLLVSSILCSVLEAESPADSVKMYLFRPGSRMEIDFQLMVLEKDRVTARRTLRLLFDQSGEGTRLLTSVTQPASLRNLKFLRVQEGNQTQLWVKTSRGVHRVGSGSRPETLFNSSFTTADFELEAGNWIFLEDLEGGRKRFGRSTDGASSGFFRQEVILRSRDGLVLESFYFNASDIPERHYQVKSWDADGPEKGYPKTLEVLSHLENRSSQLEILSVKVPDEWHPNTFSPGAL